jgi:hypothetical protein
MLSKKETHKKVFPSFSVFPVKTGIQVFFKESPLGRGQYLDSRFRESDGFYVFLASCQGFVSI